MAQTVIALAVVAATVAWAVWRLVRLARKKDGGCGCGCSGCPHSGDCKKGEF